MTAINTSVLVIGSGFGGLALAIRLRNSGFDDFIMLEKADAIGGVWRDNTYPGCACDVPSRFYSFSFEQDWEWSSRFGRQDEILAYLRYCAEKYDITRHVRLKTTVTRAQWDEAAARWRVETADGRLYLARALVSGVGLFNQPLYPDIPGREAFRGPSFHSAAWNHDFALAGKRIVVIGTGASAIQFVPELAKVAGALTVCQRSPQYVTAKDMGPPPEEQGAFERTRAWRAYDRWRIFREMEETIHRRYSHELAQTARAAWLDWLAEQLPEPELRRKLTPTYPFGCKRMLQSNDWYPALRRPNVELVDTRVAEIVADGVRLGDGRFIAADVIVYGTGFKPTDFLPGLDIVGPGGEEIHERWADGAEAYLGVVVSGFPNFFMLYGPNTNAAASIIYMLERQAHYIASCIEELDRRGAAALDVRADVQRAYNEAVHRKLNESVVAAGDCHSYFKLPNGKIVTQWPWTMEDYDRRTRRPDFDEFVFADAPSPALSPAPA